MSKLVKLDDGIELVITDVGSELSKGDVGVGLVIGSEFVMADV